MAYSGKVQLSHSDATMPIRAVSSSMPYAILVCSLADEIVNFSATSGGILNPLKLESSSGNCLSGSMLPLAIAWYQIIILRTILRRGV